MSAILHVMYACMLVCMYAYLHVCMQAGRYVGGYVGIHVSTYVYLPVPNVHGLAMQECSLCAWTVQGAKISEEGLVDELMIDAEEMHLRHSVI